MNLKYHLQVFGLCFGSYWTLLSVPRIKEYILKDNKEDCTWISLKLAIEANPYVHLLLFDVERRYHRKELV